MLINNDTYQRETLSERPIRQPLRAYFLNRSSVMTLKAGTESWLWKIGMVWRWPLTMSYYLAELVNASSGSMLTCKTTLSLDEIRVFTSHCLIFLKHCELLVLPVLICFVLFCFCFCFVSLRTSVLTCPSWLWDPDDGTLLFADKSLHFCILSRCLLLG